MDELFRFVGQINFTLSRLTFIVSQFLYDIGLEENRLAFFVNPNTEDKFKKLPGRLCKIISDDEIDRELKEWITVLCDLTRKRNTLTHSLTLSSMDESNRFRFYNYRFINKKIAQEVVELNLPEISTLNDEFVKIHNEGCNLFEKIENHVRSKTEL